MKKQMNYTSWIRLELLLVLVFVIFSAHNASSQKKLIEKFDARVFGTYTEDLDQFERFVRRAKASGATHINLSNEDLPLGYWQYDTPGDPYPSWVIT
ncbi:MAG: hypothetical protein ACP5E3_14445, partial [Bacteroidales bacterium]